MEIIKTEVELMVDQSPETLWVEFERTGSVKVYMLFVQKTQNREEKEPAGLPFHL